MRQFALRSPNAIRIEHLVEQTMGIVGGYEFIDGDHCDYPDGTDCKTASIRIKPRVENSMSHMGEISGVETAGGGQKMGGLRCVIYCAPRSELKYYFLPKSFWSDWITVHPSSGIGKLCFSYHRGRDWIERFEPYKLESFTQLSRAPRDLFERAVA
jgi:hypothetical protein